MLPCAYALLIASSLLSFMALVSSGDVLGAVSRCEWVENPHVENAS